MGQAKARKDEIERLIKRRSRFLYLCKKYTRHTDREIQVALNVRIWENKL